MRQLATLRGPLARAAALVLLALPTARAEPGAPGSAATPGTRLEIASPGSYVLPQLGPASDGPILDDRGNAGTLRAVYGDRLVLLSFIYRHCSDADGCPLAMSALHAVRSQLAGQPRLAQRTRLVTLSFDPVRDTPEAMHHYGAGFRDSRVDWRFLTSASPEALAPILERYGQPVQAQTAAGDGAPDRIAHLLRVFLIDARGEIRNIYSASFLHAAVLLADLETLRLEEQPDAAAATPQQSAASDALHGPGDMKRGYEDAAYVTHSQSVPQRRGTAADLAALIARPPLGLPTVPIPKTSPATPRRIELGRKLFFDRRLSRNATLSCALCHVPEQGFTSRELATAVGIEGRTVRRNAPSLYNVAYARRLFHDARERLLERQVWGPLLASNEMGNASAAAVFARIESLADYDGLFEAAFASRSPDRETLGMALASYQRTLLSANSRFDRWLFGGEPGALSASARRGYGLFSGRAGCTACHPIGKTDALFTDHELHNTGVGAASARARAIGRRRIFVAPGRFLEIAAPDVAAVSQLPPRDLGRFELSGDPRDRFAYRTPTLRNVALSAPYMHDGSLPSLPDVIAFYDRGGVPNPGLDPRLRPLGLTAGQREDLVAFLESLTGDNVATLVSDAFAAPIGNR